MKVFGHPLNFQQLFVKSIIEERPFLKKAVFFCLFTFLFWLYILIICFLNKELGISMNYTKLPPRESDQKVFVADIQKASKIFEWTPKISKEEGVRKMIEWVKAL